MINNMKLNQELNSASVVYSKENLGKSTKFYFCLTNLAYRERRKQIKTKYARIRERKKKRNIQNFIPMHLASPATLGLLICTDLKRL
jgi:hypothetical protein